MAGVVGAAAVPGSNQRGRSVNETERLERMIEDLRRMRDRCEPKANVNSRYLRYSNAISALLWIINDLRAEEA